MPPPPGILQVLQQPLFLFSCSVNCFISIETIVFETGENARSIQPLKIRVARYISLKNIHLISFNFRCTNGIASC
jgi:hypothetical protein